MVSVCIVVVYEYIMTMVHVPDIVSVCIVVVYEYIMTMVHVPDRTPFVQFLYQQIVSIIINY